MQRTIRKTVEYTHPPARVWAALTDSAALAAWLMPNDFEATVGHRFQFRTDPAPGFDGIVHCEVLELDEPKRMKWSWRGGNIDTLVTFELEPTATGTRLHFSQSGFRGAGAILTSFILGAGFGKMYRVALPKVLDRLARGLPAGADGESASRSSVGSAVERVVGTAASKLDGRQQ